jgi:hypothetical protein
MTFVVQYQPTMAGVPYDPVVSGGAVLSLRLYGNPERTGTIVADVLDPTRVPGTPTWQFTVDGVPDGRYWLTVRWRPSETASDVLDQTGHVDVPVTADLLVSAEDVAQILHLPLPIDAATRFSLHQYIRDAQGSVEGAIGAIFPTVRVVHGVYGTGGDPSDPATWFSDPYLVGRILSAAANDDGTHDITYTYGLDGAAEAPIRLYVKYHAAALFAGSSEGIARLGRRMTSLSVEGQSASFAAGPDAAPGGMLAKPPTLEGLVARYRSAKPKAFQRATVSPMYRPGIWTI